MTIDWAAFTPWSALAGGALIGAAATWLALANGRIAGISSILGGLLHPQPRDSGWRIAFVAGLAAAPIAYGVLTALPAIAIETGPATLVVAGLLVGVGTRYANGCTSGHGVCGLSRLSPRSAAATVAFMGAGFATVYLARHAIGG